MFLNGPRRSSKPRVAVVGCGYWGEKLVRNFAELREVELEAVCDFDLQALARIKRRYPAVEIQPKFADILSNPRVDGVVLATPVATHYAFARKALLAGKHVLVEKPLATVTAQAAELLELADKRGRILMVDHTFLYTAAVEQIAAAVERGALGELLYFDGVRVSLGLVRSDLNVLWDLGAHDLSILLRLTETDPYAISAIGAKHLGCGFENVAYLTAQFASGLVAHLHLNWLAPVKLRRILVGGSQKMIVYDDLEASEKVRIYSQGVSMNHDSAQRERLLAGYQNGDMFAPNLDTTEALRRVAADFSRAIANNERPLSDGYAGYRVVRILEAAQRSMTQGGRPVELPPAPVKAPAKRRTGSRLERTAAPVPLEV